MKLIRFGKEGSEKPGVYLDDKRYDVSHLVKDYDEAFFAPGGLQRLQAAITDQLPEVNENERWASPVARPSKIVCIGLNYADHAKESNMQMPAEPVVFFKATTSLVGPNDDLIIPKNS